MVIKVHRNTKIDYKETAKIYALEYGRRLLDVASKAVDRIDYHIVNH